MSFIKKRSLRYAAMSIAFLAVTTGCSKKKKADSKEAVRAPVPPKGVLAPDQSIANLAGEYSGDKASAIRPCAGERDRANQANKDVRVDRPDNATSYAGFFISRIDHAECDMRLEAAQSFKVGEKSVGRGTQYTSSWKSKSDNYSVWISWLNSDNSSRKSQGRLVRESKNSKTMIESNLSTDGLVRTVKEIEIVTNSLPVRFESYEEYDNESKIHRQTITGMLSDTQTGNYTGYPHGYFSYSRFKGVHESGKGTSMFLVYCKVKRSSATDSGKGLDGIKDCAFSTSTAGDVTVTKHNFFVGKDGRQQSSAATGMPTAHNTIRHAKDWDSFLEGTEAETFKKEYNPIE